MQKSQALFQLAQQVIPGGVNSPVRAFKSVGGEPIFFDRGQGAYVYSVEGDAYIDYVGSWGPLILGHAHPFVIAAVKAAVEKGLSFGAPTEAEIRIAEKICKIMPAIEMVRMVNSGTEATMTAIRLARGYTGRNKIIKFEGCYHGHSDSLLVKAGSGALTLGIPNSKGVPASFAEHTLTARFNDLESVKSLFEKWGDDIAAIILEPVVGNANCIPPLPDFLPGLRNLCNKYSSVLIFDEVMTGFRVAHGGAQQLYNITPDLVTLGKIIGGGMPVGAFGGRRDIMEQLAPLGPVYQAGTLSGNPIAMAAGLTTLNELDNPTVYQQLEKNTRQLMLGLKECADSAGIPLAINYVGSMFGLFFTEKEQVSYYEDAIGSDAARFKKFFHGMLKEGVYFAPSAYEAGFISIAHSEKEIDKTLTAASKVFKTL